MRHFCTLFNSYYQYHAYVLYNSLKQNHSNFELYCLCMDNQAYEFIQSKGQKNLIPLHIVELEGKYPQLKATRSTRSMVEYFFTCTPAICKFLIESNKDVDEIVYLDADLCFFDSPEIVFNEIGHSSVSIIPHRFKGINKLRNIYGYYNVGWVSFKNDENGKACLNDWFVKCVEWCFDKLERHRYADQKYLNAWPKKFNNICIIKNIGANAAPWNIGNYKVTNREGKIFINDTPLVFYHYASLKWIDRSYYTTISSYFTRVSLEVKKEIYLFYLQSLIEHGYKPQAGLRQKKSHFHTYIRKVIRWFYNDKVNVDLSKFESLKLFMLVHLPPPIHGASLINKKIFNSQNFNSKFTTQYCNLSTSKELNEIGHFGFHKLITTLKIQYKVFSSILFNHFDLYYVTLTTKSIGFIKDFFILVLLKLSNKKIIYHINNRGVAEHQNKLIYNLLYKFVFANTDVILTSPILYSDVEKYVDLKNVFFCPNGIEEITISNEEKRNDNTRILYLSNIIREKGVFELLKACEKLNKKGYVFECDFIGGLTDITIEEFHQKVDEFGLRNYVKYLGPKYDEEKYNELSNASVFVLPTYYAAECFPLSIIEAMQFSVPVISTKHAAIPEIIDDGINGFIITPKDPYGLAEKIEILINDTDLRKRMGKNARKKYLEKFTFKQFENNLTEIINNVYRKRAFK